MNSIPEIISKIIDNITDSRKKLDYLNSEILKEMSILAAAESKLEDLRRLNTEVTNCINKYGSEYVSDIIGVSINEELSSELDSLKFAIREMHRQPGDDDD
jgi:hypothetical protein